MTFFRLLLLLAAVWIAWYFLRRLRTQITHKKPPPPESYEPMARCARCGVHQPAASLSSNGLCGRCATA